MRRAIHAVLVLIWLNAIAALPAIALEFTCIEASRYRHLYQLTGGDLPTFAAHLELDQDQLPRPDHCRAMFVSGKVEPRAGGDVDKLLNAIVENEGWLATLHLSSGGGIVQTGYELGFVTRMFWLKTHTASASDRIYVPDFFVPPPSDGPQVADDEAPTEDRERLKNWHAFVAAQKKLRMPNAKAAGCASACGFIHTAGIDRSGQVRVHRARAGGAAKGEFINTKKTMSETDRNLLRLELEQIEFYRQMDPGPDFIPRYQETAAQTVTPVDVARFPRYVADYLTGKCRVLGDQLSELDRQLSSTIGNLNAAMFGLWIKTDHLRRSLRELRVRRAAAERCIAAAHERERLSHFSSLCPKGCDRAKLQATIKAKVAELTKVAR